MNKFTRLDLDELPNTPTTEPETMSKTHDQSFLNPPPALLCKLASIAVHADEMLSPMGHGFDKIALQSAISDSDVQEWLKAMTKAAMAPVQRTQPK
jgi:hypothetical protein